MSDRDELLRTVTGTRLETLERRRARVQVVSGRDARLERTFEGRLRIGSRALADLSLADPKVSSLHCELECGEVVRLRDLGSKNGTFVAGVRVFDALVPPGATITVGDTQLRVAALDERVAVELHPGDRFVGLVGRSAPMRALAAQVARLAAGDATVLVTGETGTGKELVAEALHTGGPRAERPLVVVDCGALPGGLVESELFGHERGAFTGAVAAQAGAFERAGGGTVFLDEIGELPLDLQPKLLRAIEAREVRRLGGGKPLTFDARIVAATHRDLAREVQRGRFREDLYWRLAVVTLEVPPLRDRLDDLPQLAVHLLGEMGVDPAACLTVEALGALAAHDWPGNVRELRNTLERAAALAEPVRPSAGPRAAGGSSPAAQAAVDLEVPLRIGKQRAIESFERRYLTALLEECGGNVSEAARRAGMDRMSIHRMIERLGLRGDGG
jgi:transcriptional regulator with GAF, ATPase, and Fis domain